MAKMMMRMSVYDAAFLRTNIVFDNFERVAVSFSGGKDSGVMLHIAAKIARERRRKIAVLFVDLEAQYEQTIDYVEKMFDLYSDVIDPYWVALPLILRNAVSMYQPSWVCWDPREGDKWVRDPPDMAETAAHRWEWFRPGMEFEEFVPLWADWYSEGKPTASLVGIRAQESLNRFRTLCSKKKKRFDKYSWTTYKGPNVVNCYPIYDWKTEDIWRYNGKFKAAYNPLYDMMYKAGLTIHQSRICQPYGDDQRRGLRMYQVIEPETWDRVVQRVLGVNAGAYHCGERGNILGNHKVELPGSHETWESYAKFLLSTLPAPSRKRFENKIWVFLAWYRERGYPESIPDVADAKEEAARKVPSWRRICKAILKNDYNCKSLSFGQTSSDGDYYEQIMRKRKARRNENRA